MIRHVRFPSAILSSWQFAPIEGIGRDQGITSNSPCCNFLSRCPASWRAADDRRGVLTSATLKPESQEQLRNIAEILKAYPRVNVRIGGYTDNVGDSQANLRLSQDRADNVMKELAALGVASERMTAEGYGDQHPVGDNSTERGRAMNRRIALRVTEK